MAGPKKKPVKKQTSEPAPKPVAKEVDKDPAVAALISVVCLLVLQAPSLGYIYLGKVKKGLIYLAATWGSWILVTIIYFIGMFTGIGVLLCLPVFILPLLFELYMVWDVYLDAKGERTKLPEFD